MGRIRNRPYGSDTQPADGSSPLKRLDVVGDVTLTGQAELALLVSPLRWRVIVRSSSRRGRQCLL